MKLEKLNHVLCVNDNDITLFILKRTISKANFCEKISEKNNGYEALKYCERLLEETNQESDFPQLIFLDLHMPILDGWEFLNKFRDTILPARPGTKVIITSQSVDDRDTERSRQYPFVIDFLTNAMSVDYLNAVLQRFKHEFLVEH